MSKFEIFKDNAGQFRWRFTASNGKIIAVSSESYCNKSDCTASINLVKRDAPTAPIHDLT